MPNDLTAEIFNTVRAATRALYPEARIPETAMDEPKFKIPPSLFPIRILQDGFDGAHSGGRWIAYVDDRDGRDDDVWNGSQAGCDRGWKQGDTAEVAAKRFWAEEAAGKWWIAVGDTPNDALAALLAKARGEP